MPQLDIPQTVAEILDDSATFEPGTIAAVRAFARSKPWKGNPEERLAKFRECLNGLVAAYGLDRVSLEVIEQAAPAPIDPLVALLSGGAVARDAYITETRTIKLSKLSVVTFLHLFAMARGFTTPRQCYRWSINLFRRCFPKSYGRCRHVGPNLVAAGDDRFPAEPDEQD